MRSVEARNRKSEHPGAKHDRSSNKTESRTSYVAEVTRPQVKKRNEHAHRAESDQRKSENLRDGDEEFCVHSRIRGDC